MRALALALAAGLAAPSVRAEVAPIRVDAKKDVAITAAAAATALALNLRALEPTRCEVCTPDALDLRVTRDLVWRSPQEARAASDVLANGIVPVGAALALTASAWHAGEPSAAFADLLVVAEAASIAAIPEGVAKDVVARRRPEGGLRSFYSGHASLSFSVAAAAGTVSTMRGYRSAPWIWAGGMTLASGVAYLRVAGDAHWLTDVVAGAAAGGLVGFAVPWFLHRAPASASRRYDFVPAPGGVAVVF